MRNLRVFPIEASDIPFVEEWRERFLHASFDLPHGYSGPSTVTLVAAMDDKLVGAMVGSLGVTIDIIKNPDMPPLILAEAVQRLEENITVHAALNGAIDSYISIPNVPELAAFHETVQRRGYEITSQDCTIYRRSLSKVAISKNS